MREKEEPKAALSITFLRDLSQSGKAENDNFVWVHVYAHTGVPVNICPVSTSLHTAHSG